MNFIVYVLHIVSKCEGHTPISWENLNAEFSPYVHRKFESFAALDFSKTVLLPRKEMTKILSRQINLAKLSGPG